MNFQLLQRRAIIHSLRHIRTSQMADKLKYLSSQKFIQDQWLSKCHPSVLPSPSAFTADSWHQSDCSGNPCRLAALNISAAGSKFVKIGYRNSETRIISEKFQ